MKKGLLFLVLILASAVLFAAGLDDVGGTKSATAKAYVNLTDPGAQFVEVGFSSKEVTLSEGKLSGVTAVDADGIALTTNNATDGKAANEAESLFVYGHMFTNIGCNLTLSAKSMQGYSDQGKTPTTDRLGFTVVGTSMTDDSTETLIVEKVANDTSAATSDAFISHTGNGGSSAPTESFECFDLKITTKEPISSGTKGSVYYSTVITATISADGN